jgi:hypothetical protein
MHPTIRHLPISLTLLFLTGMSLCLVAFQPPSPDGTGNGVITVQVVTPAGASLAGIRVRYLDEWQRQAYGTCTTDGQGQCVIAVENAPTLGVMLRGVLEVEGSDRLRDAMLMVNETVTVSVMLDSGGEVQVDADVLATRNPNATPTLIGVEDALATLTAAAEQPIATPSPGIEQTVAAAHGAMTATTVARTSLTPTPRFTPTASATPNVGVAVIVNNTSAPMPETYDSTEESPAEGVTFAELLQVGVRLTALFMVSSLVLVVGGAWWIRRRRAGGGK